MTSEAATALVCREKRRTFALFAGDDFCPAIHPDAASVPAFPVFVKPDIGEGGRNARVIADREALSAALAADPDLIVCEHLPGEEYTVDCFTDRHGTLLFAGPRSRDRVKMGISFASRTQPLTDEIAAVAERINGKLAFRGLWFFQLKRAADGRLKLLEVSTRLAGTMAVYRQLGVNFALLSAFDAQGRDVAILKNNLDLAVDRCLLGRYRLDYDYDTAFLDYDDTIVHEGQVNDLVLRFLYQCANRGVRMVLITRHRGDLAAHMKAHRIAPELFDEIHHIPNGALKSAYVKGPRAIFIDNHFPERLEVARACGVPVFDVDAVECLLA
ncbi:MAG: ATP-grasp domain-containing protein [Caulobacterales bacterium]|nr:ATP-grasp domain-containing protein [Caulobacterales bacterium]